GGGHAGGVAHPVAGAGRPARRARTRPAAGGGMGDQRRHRRMGPAQACGPRRGHSCGAGHAMSFEQTRSKQVAKPDPAFFHQIYGEKSSRLVYRGDDFLDYALMTVLAWCVAAAVYGPWHPLSLLAMALCTWMIGAFVLRHRATLAVPL